MPRVNNASNNVVNMDLDNGDKKEQPDWLTKLKSGSIEKKKVPKDVQKRRRNYRHGNLLIPKPPVMAIMELIKQDEVVYGNPIMDPLTRLLKITATYDGVTFEGVGPNKNIAKNICSENVLQYIAFRACKKDQEVGAVVQGNQGEMETPWTSLASVALFKMFNDWQAQGAEVPVALMKCKPIVPVPPPPNNGFSHTEDVNMAAPKPKIKKERKPRIVDGVEIKKELPEDAASKHPVMLLHEMKGQLDYEIVSEGAFPNAVYHCTVTVDNQRFTGTFRNKKEAKKNAAANAMAVIYGVNYN